MKTLRLVLGLASGSAVLLAQNVESPSAPAPAVALRSAAEIEQLVAPIALYPDALLALLLPAATAPTDIVLAARLLRETPGDTSQIEHRAWDESVKSLTSYPEVLKWMDENLQWTKQLGEAFNAQPADVMQAVQRLRIRAQAAGTLVDTPQQQVIAEPEAIRIVPAQPDVIYVPYYEPDYVFYGRPAAFYQPIVTFGVGVRVGSWLAFECDWRRNSIWIGNRHRRWTGHDWRRPLLPVELAAPARGRGTELRLWRPTTHYPRTTYVAANYMPPPIARPSPYVGHSAHGSASAAAPGYAARRGDSRPIPPAGPTLSSGSDTTRFVVPAPAYGPLPATSPAANPAAGTPTLYPGRNRTAGEAAREREPRAPAYRREPPVSNPPTTSVPPATTAPAASPAGARPTPGPAHTYRGHPTSTPATTTPAAPASAGVSTRAAPAAAPAATTPAKPAPARENSADRRSDRRGDTPKEP